MSPFVIFLILIVIIALIVSIFAIREGKRKPKYALPVVNSKTTSLVMNDKLIVVVGAKAEEIKEIVLSFCRLYNRNDYRVDVKLHPIEEKIMALTFPNDIDFVVFFYLIKNLAYSYQDVSLIKALGWCTLLPIDKEKPLAQQAMIYTTSNPADKHLYLSTQDNVCWRINFDKNRYEPVTLIQNFTRPPYTYLEVKHRDGILLS